MKILYIFLYLWAIFLPSWIRIRIQRLKLLRIRIHNLGISLDWLTWRLQSYFQTIVHTPHGTHMMGAQGMMGPAIAGSGAPPPVRPLLAAPAAHHQQTVAASVVPPPSLPPPPTKYQVPVLLLVVGTFYLNRGLQRDVIYLGWPIGP